MIKHPVFRAANATIALTASALGVAEMVLPSGVEMIGILTTNALRLPS
jgi:hypothetical protein